MLKKIIKKIRFELQFHNTAYYTRLSDKFFKTYYTWLLRKKIRSLKSIKLDPAGSDLTVAILANKKNFFESIAALYSFCYHTSKVYVHYYEDGTLSEKDINYLNKLFPGIEVYKRAEQNLKVANYLSAKGLTNCTELREHFLFSIRLFDMIIQKKTKYLLQIDSDVLFFSKPHELLAFIGQYNINGCYNADLQSMYSYGKDVMAKYLTGPSLTDFNAGLFMHNLNESFFEFVERIIEKEPQGRSSWHLEQTLFMMYAALIGGFAPLPLHYDVVRRERSLGNKLISEHYCHNTGYDFHKDFLYKIAPTFNIKQPVN